MNEPSTTASPVPGTPAPGTPAPTTWPILHCTDARAVIAFLAEAFGFVESLVVPGERDPEQVAHAELLWPEGGGIMLGSVGHDDGPFAAREPGKTSIYVVTDHPDDLFARATGAGAEVIMGLTDTHYGSRDFSVADPEGNVWSFGTYRGEPAPR